jgi:hypothetical protein
MIVSKHRRDETIDSAATPLDQLVQKRLDIVRMGLTEVHRRLDDGLEFDAEVILRKIDEDLHMLQRRLRREVSKVVAG